MNRTRPGMTFGCATAMVMGVFCLTACSLLAKPEFAVIDVNGKVLSQSLPLDDPLVREFAARLAVFSNDPPSDTAILNAYTLLCALPWNHIEAVPAIGGDNGEYLSRSGEVVRTFDDAVFGYPSSEGLTGVVFRTLPDGKPNDNVLASYIDRAGEVVIPPKYQGRWFSEGLAVAGVPGATDTDFRQGYMDRNGVMVIPPKYVGAHAFSEGLAFVREPLSDTGYYIDKQGNKVFDLPTGIEEGSEFESGVAICGDFSNRWVVVNTTGEVLAEGECEAFHGFYGGRAAICVKGKWGYIDSRGEFAIEPQYDFATSFMSDRAIVATGRVGAFAIDAKSYGLWGNI